jgi:predicted transposase YbfD/YdcC
MAFSPLSLRKYLRRLKDPRIERCKRHLLIDILAISICAVISGADTWREVALFARRRQEWFQRFLPLPNGIPSRQTIERLFDRLDPAVLQRCLLEWLHDVSGATGIRHIAIDGKTLRHSGGGASPLRCLHLVSAWATEANLTLGQVATDEKSNEITAIPRLLELLDLKGAFVTIDAMGCQKAIAKQIIDQGGDYALPVKGNQEHLEEDIRACFIRAYDQDLKEVKYQRCETEEKGHGRHEKRVCEVIYEPEGIRHQDAWAQLRVVGKIYRERTANGKTSAEEQYFIGSKCCSAKQYAKVMRKHWGIENQLHWQLDVTFGEDASRIQKRQAGENVALLRRVALGLLKQQPGKESIKCKRYAAALDVNVLEDIVKNHLNLGKLK